MKICRLERRPKERLATEGKSKDPDGAPVAMQFREFLRDRQGLASEYRILVSLLWETAIVHHGFFQLLSCPLIVRVHLER